jgi:hypothetical protein
LRDIGEWAESRGNNERGVDRKRGGEDGGYEREWEVNVMTREAGHVVLGVCSPFEEASDLISEFYLAFQKFQGQVRFAQLRR